MHAAGMARVLCDACGAWNTTGTPVVTGAAVSGPRGLPRVTQRRPGPPGLSVVLRHSHPEILSVTRRSPPASPACGVCVWQVWRRNRTRQEWLGCCAVHAEPGTPPGAAVSGHRWLPRACPPHCAGDTCASHHTTGAVATLHHRHRADLRSAMAALRPSCHTACDVASCLEVARGRADMAERLPQGHTAVQIQCLTFDEPYLKLIPAASR